MNIELHLSKNLFIPKFFPYLFDYSKRWEVHRGSAGSGKSYYITQKIILRCLNEKIRVLVCRRYASTIRQTAFALFKDILTSWKLMDYVNIRETDFNIQFKNGSEIIFVGLDDEFKLLSLTNIGTIFVEEASECSRDMIDQLNIRLRGKNKNQQIFLAFNPVSKTNYLYDFCELNPPENMLYITSSYRDNPFLPKEYVEALEGLVKTNPRKAEVYVYNQWGTVDTEGLVFQNWRVEDFDVMEIAAKPNIERRCGVDFGFVDATAIADSLYDANTNTIYVINEFYKSGQTLDQVAVALEEMNMRKVKIWADAAEPRSIDFFRRKGFAMYPCIKGQGSVEARITFLQNNNIIILPKCENAINEFSNLQYIKDKQTGRYSDRMTHDYTHFVDGLGYAYSNIYTNNKLRTLDKKVLGIR